jgi:hypothetical protein
VVTATAAETLAELEEKLRTGDTTVTAAGLAKARQAAEHEALVAQGAEAQADAERQRQLEADRAEFLDRSAALLDEIVDAIDEYNRAQRSATAQAKKLGIPELAPGAQIVKDRILADAEGETRGRYPTRLKASPRLRYDSTSGQAVVDTPRLRRNAFHSDEHAAAAQAVLDGRADSLLEAKGPELERRRREVHAETLKMNEAARRRAEAEASVIARTPGL